MCIRMTTEPRVGLVEVDLMFTVLVDKLREQRVELSGVVAMK